MRSDALPLSHKDSSVSGVYYEVLMTRVLHTARISNVDSLWGLRIFSLSHARDKTKKTSFLKHKDFRKYRKCFIGSQKQPNIFLLQTEIAKDV